MTTTSTNVYQNVAFSDAGLQITYIAPDGVDTESGIAEVIVVEIPHGVITNSHLEDLTDSLDQILNLARIARRRPAPTIPG